MFCQFFLLKKKNQDEMKNSPTKTWLWDFSQLKQESMEYFPNQSKLRSSRIRNSPEVSKCLQKFRSSKSWKVALVKNAPRIVNTFWLLLCLSIAFLDTERRRWSREHQFAAKEVANTHIFFWVLSTPLKEIDQVWPEFLPKIMNELWRWREAPSRWCLRLSFLMLNIIYLDKLIANL